MELYFSPPNTTSKIQPCDVGIIRAFKVHYRRRFYSRILQMIEVGSPNFGKINILGVINFATMAWSFDVTTKTITNYFHNCKIRSKEVDVSEIEDGQLE